MNPQTELGGYHFCR